MTKFIYSSRIDLHYKNRANNYSNNSTLTFQSIIRNSLNTPKIKILHKPSCSFSSEKIPNDPSKITEEEEGLVNKY